MAVGVDRRNMGMDCLLRFCAKGMDVIRRCEMTRLYNVYPVARPFLLADATAPVAKERAMSTPAEPRRQGRTSALSTLLWIVVLPLSQAGLGYPVWGQSVRSSSPWPWLVGTPLCSLLIGVLAASRASGGLAPVQARTRGAHIGIITGIGGAVLAALLVALCDLT